MHVRSRDPDRLRSASQQLLAEVRHVEGAVRTRRWRRRRSTQRPIVLVWVSSRAARLTVSPMQVYVARVLRAGVTRDHLPGRDADTDADLPLIRRRGGPR